MKERFRMVLPDLQDRKFIVIGGGPAGLTAARDLTKFGICPLVLEKRDKVGGIARTENYRGYYFDMGGHRFFTKSTEVNRFWHEVLGDDFLVRPRLSRIYYQHKYFYYPLKPLNALAGLGLWQSILVGLSYLRWHLFPYKQEDTFEQWVTNRFGKQLFSIFFKSYTEKVWGIPTSELSAEWAAQRIKDLDLKAAVLSMFIPPKNTIQTLIEEFHYPRQGPGMLWTMVKEDIERKGGEVWLDSNVCGIQRDGNRISSIRLERHGVEETISGTDFISSMPITEFIHKLDPPPPAEVLEAAKNLSYRDFLTVCLILKRKQLFDDNWIYIHDPGVKVGRIQNFKNWSPEMVPDPETTSLGLEYFCNEGDELWNMPDDQLIELGRQEIEKIGLAQAVDVIDGSVFRVEKSYPVYDSTYRTHLAVLREYVDGLQNFKTIGRNGLHRYNNQDHAMLTGMLAVRSLVLGEENNLWVVNAEQEYHEEIKLPEVPHLEQVLDDAFARAFMKLDPIAHGFAMGLVGGLCVFLVTAAVSLSDVDGITGFLLLLSQYFPGYDVNLAGGILGFIYVLVLGFLVGWLVAALRNKSIQLYISILSRRAEMKLMNKKGYFPDAQSSRSTDPME
jgi:protoporphyrinogen oxidase